MNLSILIGFVKVQVLSHVRSFGNTRIIITFSLLSLEKIFLKLQDVNKVEIVLNPRFYSSYAHHNIVYRGFILDIECIDHLFTQLVSTSNYSATANLHVLQITTAPAKLFPSLCLHEPFPGNGV
jgi:hypothetical protein